MKRYIVSLDGEDIFTGTSNEIYKRFGIDQFTTSKCVLYNFKAKRKYYIRNELEEGYKRCSVCGKVFKEEYFSHGWCKFCRSDKSREYYERRRSNSTD